jgi:hypothetical protein
LQRRCQRLLTGGCTLFLEKLRGTEASRSGSREHADNRLSDAGRARG